MSTNFAETLVWKHEYDVKMWRHKQLTPNKNDDICHWMNREPPPMKTFCVRHWYHITLLTISERKLKDISRQTITLPQAAMVMKTVTITWPLQSRLLNSTLCWSVGCRYQTSKANWALLVSRKSWNSLSWGVLQKNRVCSSFGEYDSSNWGSVFFPFLQLWSFSIWFLLA